MLTVSDVSKSFGGQTLFANASLQVNRGDRIGLVGPNGAGKSTLFGLILGESTPDQGAMALQKNCAVGHLPQETAPVGDETVLELTTYLSPEFRDLERRIAAWDAGAEHSGDPAEVVAAQHRFEELGGYHVQAQAKKLLRGLGFKEKDFARPLREMSGGWVMRAYLAQLLLRAPDLLMLDEPTNHLDLEALLWFQNYLKGYQGAILVISHDREFLNQLVGSIVEIRQGKLWRYTGNYDEYLVQREAQHEQLQAAYKNQQREIDRLMEFVNRFRAKNTKATQAQSKLKQIERMEKIEAPVSDTREIRFRFPQPQRGGLKTIALKGVDHAYGANVVYRGLNFQVERGQRIVLVGPNGAGKSTLMKLLAGVLPVQAGERILGHNIRAGYFSQYRTEMLTPEHTVLEEALDTSQPVSEQTVRTLLGCFLFTGDDVFKRVSVLSGGEKSRLALVKILLDPPNLLLMDEPTTHLDMSSIEALIAALEQFEGTLIFISHDVYFIRSIANCVVHVENGEVTTYPGSYSYYEDKRTRDAKASANPAAEERERQSSLRERPSVKLKEQKRREAEERQARSQARKSRQKAVDRLESQIARLEQRQLELTAVLEDPDTYASAGRALETNRELSDVVSELARLNAEWELAASDLADFDAA